MLVLKIHIYKVNEKSHQTEWFVFLPSFLATILNAS